MCIQMILVQTSLNKWLCQQFCLCLSFVFYVRQETLFVQMQHKEEQVMCVIDAFSVSAQEWCIDNDGKFSFVTQVCRLINWLNEYYFLVSFIVIPHQQHTKHTQTKLYSQYSQKVPFTCMYLIEYINSNMTWRLHKIKCT